MNSRLKIIQFFKNNTGEWISGEKISRKLNRSVSVVLKTIGLLKSEGYKVESHPDRVYRISSFPDRYEKEELAALLQGPFAGGEVYLYESVDSTNTRAAALAGEGAPEGSIVIAESQSRGKGRMGREWDSPRGKGIYLSMILRPAMEPDKVSTITLAAAVALIETFSFFDSSLSAEIKWPNDILVHSKKLAGILTEMSAEAEAVNYIILGTGINIHHENTDFAKPLQSIATSFYLENKKEIYRSDFIGKYIEIFVNYYNDITSRRPERIIEKFNKYSAIVGKEIQVSMGHSTAKGRVSQINRDGSLCLIASSGERIDILAGDISYREK